MLAVARGKKKICLYSFPLKEDEHICFDSIEGSSMASKSEIERETRETEQSLEFSTPSIKFKICGRKLETTPISFKHRGVDLELEHDHFHGEILVGDLLQPEYLTMHGAKLPPFYRYISGECVLNLTKGKFVQFNF